MLDTDPEGAFAKAAKSIKVGSKTMEEIIRTEASNWSDLHTAAVDFMYQLSYADYDLSKLGESVWTNIETAVANTKGLDSIEY